MFRIAVIASLFATAIAANTHERGYYEQKFFDWMQEHDVKAGNGEIFVHWLKNFADNQDLIEESNSKDLTYKLGHNKFSHLSFEEFKVAVGLGLAPRPKDLEAPIKIHVANNATATAASVDWVVAGAVTPVKDQGQCGSCWSFSTTGALEGAYQIKTKALKSFSEQNLVDCDTYQNGGTDLGCKGGLMDSAFSWTKSNGGLCSEESYPYTSGVTKERSSCTQGTSCTLDAGVAPTSYTDVETSSDAAMMSALEQQPVSIAIEADQAAFQLYSSGVFTGKCGTSLDHGVLAVGYGTLDGSDYYKVKNSWGASWGMDGYILLGRGLEFNGGAGQCGMLSGPPSYPTL